MSARSILLISTCLMIGIWSSAADAAPPAGSYRQSCTNIKTYPGDGIVYATCKTITGGWNNTRTYYKDCAGDLGNNDGELTCWHTTPIANGSYLASCYNSFMGGRHKTRLYSTCATGQVSPEFCAFGLFCSPEKVGVKPAMLLGAYNCKGDIANINGTLTCPK